MREMVGEKLIGSCCWNTGCSAWIDLPVQFGPNLPSSNNFVNMRPSLLLMDHFTRFFLFWRALFAMMFAAILELSLRTKTHLKCLNVTQHTRTYMLFIVCEIVMRLACFRCWRHCVTWSNLDMLCAHAPCAHSCHKACGRKKHYLMHQNFLHTLESCVTLTNASIYLCTNTHSILHAC